MRNKIQNGISHSMTRILYIKQPVSHNLSRHFS